MKYLGQMSTNHLGETVQHLKVPDTQECLLGDMTPGAIRTLISEGGAYLLVRLIGKENREDVLAALRGDNIAGISDKVMAALEICLTEAAATNTPRPLRPRNVHERSATIGELGELLGAENSDGTRNAFSLFSPEEGVYMITRNGEPIVQRPVVQRDDYGNPHIVRRERISFDEASVLFAEYMNNLEDALEEFNNALEFKKYDEGLGMTMDPAMIAQIEKVWKQYHALTTVIFIKHPTLYQLCHLLRSPLYSLVCTMYSHCDGDTIDENVFLVEEDDRNHILGLQGALKSSLDLVDKLFDAGDENIRIQEMDLNTTLSELIQLYEHNPNFNVEDPSVEARMIASPRTMIFILQNYCENALRMGFSVTVEPIVTSEYLEIRVHDDGAQIDPKTVSGLFKKSISTVDGSGHGLVATNRIVRDLQQLNDIFPGFKNFDSGFCQCNEPKTKYFFIRVPRVADAEIRSEQVSDGPRAVAA